MKKKSEGRGVLYFQVKKIWLMMRLSILLILLAMASVSASVYSQNTRFTLKMKNSRIADVFDAIEQQSEFYFFYNRDHFNDNRIVQVDIENKSILQVLNQLFQDEPISYEIVDRNILIKADKTDFRSGQQQKTVRGSIVDSSGAPLPGVSIAIKGTTTGAISDFDGNFTLSNVPEDATLIFSFVGMKTEEIPVAGQSFFNITMTEDAIGIEEVVAIGYGTQKKINLTGAVGVAQNDKLENRPIVSLGQGLQGLIPNLNITTASGRPGAAAQINLRGTTSINGGSPLVLVDGIEMDPNTINPNDVESVVVLKDAASAAIYGVRGAFGVILITTKNVKTGTPLSVTYSSNFALNVPTRMPETINSADFIKASMAANNSGKLSGGYTSWLSFTPEYLARVEKYMENPIPENSVFVDPNDVTGADRYLYSGNTNWVEELYSSAASHHSHNLNFSGASKKTSYLASFGFLDQDGILKVAEDNFKRYNANMKLSTEMTKWLNLNFNIKINRAETDNPAGSRILSNPISLFNDLRPMMPVRHPDGNYSGQGWWTNPVAHAKESGRRKINNNELITTGGFNLKPLKNINIVGDYTWKISTESSTENRKTYNEYGVNGVLLGTYPWTTPANVTKGSFESSYQVANLYGSYENKFNEKHYVKLMGGLNREVYTQNNFRATAKDLINQDYPSLSLSNDDKPSVGSSATEWAVAGYFFRANYVFNDRYLIEINGRYDGSSRFPSSNRQVFQPSISAGWNISEESFFPGISGIDLIKLRGSYGTLGNQQLEANYPYIAIMGNGTTSHIFGTQRQTFIGAPGLVSSNFTWEKVSTTNVGLDWILFNNRLSGSFDYYIRSTKDMVVAGQPLPAILGTGAPSQNAADLENKGFEFTMSWKDNVSNDLFYSVDFVLSDYSAKITKYSLNPTNSLSASYYEGQKIGEIWGFETVGFYKTDADAAAVDNSQIWSGKWLAGDIQYKDLNGDEKISYGTNTVDDPGDRKIIGNSTPRYQFGLNLDVDYKNFFFTAFLQGVLKRDIALGGPYFWGLGMGSEWFTPTEAYAGNYWTPENPNAYFARPRYDGVNTLTQTKYLQDASYLRMKAITLGYSIPSSVLQKFGISKFDIYVSGENLFEITSLYKNYDPEQFDRLDYALYRTIAVGLKISL